MYEDLKQFYVTLFSNASTNLYPGNTIVTFTADLTRPIELGSSDNWEVGLCEFSYPPNNVGTFKPTIIVGDNFRFIYCDLLSPQYDGENFHVF